MNRFPRHSPQYAGLNALLLLMFALQTVAIGQGTTFYVDVDHPNADDSGFGTSLIPWKTLTRAFDLTESTVVASGDTIIVRSGDYDADTSTNGVAELFPLELPTGVEVRGANDSNQAPSLAERPRIGGGTAGPATHLFAVTATTADKTTGTISRLRFVGEDEPGLDSPIALMIVAENGYWADVDFSDNICERPHMNDSSVNGLATIHAEVDEGRVTGRIADCVIETSDRGGVEILSLQHPGASENSDADLIVERCNLTNPGGAYSLFAIRWHAPDLDANTQALVTGSGFIDNTIQARNSNIQTGIEIHADEDTQGSQSFGVTGNFIDGCNLSGIVLRADGDDKGGGTDSVPEVIVGVDLNVVLNCGESGIRLVWDERDHPTDNGLGYLLATIRGNLLADNGEYGIDFTNWDDESMGGINSQSNTIVHNGLGAFSYSNFNWNGPSVLPNVIGGLDNELVYFNNPTGPGTWGPQVVGLDAMTELPVFEARIEYSNWQGIASCNEVPPNCSNNNIDEDPDLAQDQNGWYHLRSESPCVDAGLDGIDLTKDIDGDRRSGQDGNCDSIEHIDIGADEVPEDCP